MRTYMLPEKRDSDGGWTWPKLRIEDTTSKEKGRGCFAAESLPSNLAIPYYGETCTIRPEDVRYVFGINSKLYIDGHPGREPDRQQGIGGRGKYIAAMINEPHPGQMANTVFVCATKENKQTRSRVHVVTIRPVKRGEELTVYYGMNYEREYLVGKRGSLSTVGESSKKKKRRRTK